MAKMAIDSGTQGRKNKVLKWPIDLTGNKVTIVDKCPVKKSPPTFLAGAEVGRRRNIQSIFNVFQN